MPLLAPKIAPLLIVTCDRSPDTARIVVDIDADHHEVLDGDVDGPELTAQLAVDL